ncbi:unnamed protein product [Rotaria magnacalcarata]|uniref:Uncharacterized protein n=1 Tax=Rotaria magnacalcarata TaxID=392030 RepID=A0A819AX81_9BILA|nr:unnamed protein product [Rotaria magnacalcarata]CAF3792080.1 unnamed protein product [Rotaria magnacalcarata]
MKKYQDKIKEDKVKYDAAKAKVRARNNSIRTKLTEVDLAKFRLQAKSRQQKCRENKRKRLINIPSMRTFKTHQSFSKTLKKFCLLSKSKHQRTSLKLADKLKDDVHNFYVRNNISYQLPGKRDVVITKEDDGSKITYQKRILLNSLRENYELFKEENKNVNLSRSSFAEFRPVFVIPKAALAHRNCLCLYHENICLLLKSLDKYVGGNYCSSLETFTDILVCSTNNEDCIVGCCVICENFFSDKVEEQVSNGSAKIAWSQMNE